MTHVAATVWHQAVFGTDPTAEQLKLYDCWPNLRGFSDRALNPERAEAVILLALRSGSGTDRVVLLAPQMHESWLLKQIETAALRCFEDCPKRYAGRAVEMIHGFSQLFQKVRMTGRVLQMAEEPVHWVSFGFSAEDTLPPWMQGRLLTL